MPQTGFPFIYGITDADLMPGELLFSKVEAVLAAGLKLLQYRDKSSNDQKREREGRTLLRLCRQYGARLIVNDDVKLARRIEADGVHLGLRDDTIASARAVLGADALIGATCHNQLQLATDAITNGASYIAFGRFYPSKTKAAAQAAELSVLTQARKQFAVPVVGIGGITTGNASAIWSAGAHCAAVCHSLFGTDDPATVCKQFADIYENQHEYE